jgi:hypothetical protein
MRRNYKYIDSMMEAVSGSDVVLAVTHNSDQSPYIASAMVLKGHWKMHDPYNCDAGGHNYTILTKGDRELGNAGYRHGKINMAIHATRNIYIPPFGLELKNFLWNATHFCNGENLVANYTLKKDVVVVIGYTQIEAVVGALSAGRKAHLIVADEKQEKSSRKMLEKIDKIFDDFIPLAYPSDVRCATAGALLAVTKKSKNNWDLECLAGLVMPWISDEALKACTESVMVTNCTDPNGPVQERECFLLPEERKGGLLYLKEADDMGVGVFALQDCETGIDLAEVRGFYFPQSLGKRLITNLGNKDFFPRSKQSRGILKRISPYTFVYHNATSKIVDFHFAWSAATYINSCHSPNGKKVAPNCTFHVEETCSKALTITVRTIAAVKKVIFQHAMARNNK